MQIVCSIALLILQKSFGILELSLWNLDKNVEIFTRKILVMDGSTGMSQNRSKIKNMIPIQSSTQNKKVLKVWQYWISEKQAFSNIIILSFTSFNICWLSDFSSSENWWDWPDPQSILSSSDSLFIIYDWYICFRGFKLFCILLGHLGNSATWIFTFSYLLTLFNSFWRFIRAVWFNFFILSFVSHGSRL